MGEPDYSERLRSLLSPVQLSSFRELSRAAGVSLWQVNQLRQGQALHMRVEALIPISQALQISLDALIAQFSSSPSLVGAIAPPDSAEAITGEAIAKEAITAAAIAAFQDASLQTLESLLIQLPTAIHAAQQKPDIPASRLIPLLRPIDRLLQDWGIEAIAPVGAEVPYDPHRHQLMDGTAQPDDLVRVRYTGYQQGDRLLYRAKVSPVPPS